MAARKRRRKSASKVSIKRGTCKVVRGRIRICNRGGRLVATPLSGGTTRRRKRRTTKRRKLKKLRKPKMCKTKPTMRKGRCTCTLKSGKKKLLRVGYCRAPKRKGVRRRKRR